VFRALQAVLAAAGVRCGRSAFARRSLVKQKPRPVRVAFFRGPDGELVELLEDKTGYT